MYEVNLKLNHNEAAAIIDKETGEVRQLPDKWLKPKSTKTVEKFNLMKSYTRFNSAAWQLLATQIDTRTLDVAHKLAHMARAFTNSLIPLNDETTQLMLADTLKINRKYVDKCIKQLFDLGVIGKFEVTNANKQHTKYWVFNPYLAFNGKVIEKGIAALFAETTYARF